jgi:hypothetical protein
MGRTLENTLAIHVQRIALLSRTDVSNFPLTIFLTKSNFMSYER